MVERAGFENRYDRKVIVGSNPTPSASERSERGVWDSKLGAKREFARRLVATSRGLWKSDILTLAPIFYEENFVKKN